MQKEISIPRSVATIDDDKSNSCMKRTDKRKSINKEVKFQTAALGSLQRPTRADMLAESPAITVQEIGGPDGPSVGQHYLVGSPMLPPEGSDRGHLMSQ